MPSPRQFQYNHRWIHARAFLLDAFELLTPLGYRLGKLTPFGVEFYPHWDPELETFVEGNYIACSARAPGCCRRFPGGSMRADRSDGNTAGGRHASRGCGADLA